MKNCMKRIALAFIWSLLYKVQTSFGSLVHLRCLSTFSRGSRERKLKKAISGYLFRKPNPIFSHCLSPWPHSLEVAEQQPCFKLWKIHLTLLSMWETDTSASQTTKGSPSTLARLSKELGIRGCDSRSFCSLKTTTGVRWCWNLTLITALFRVCCRRPQLGYRDTSVCTDPAGRGRQQHGWRERTCSASTARNCRNVPSLLGNGHSSSQADRSCFGDGDFEQVLVKHCFQIYSKNKLPLSLLPASLPDNECFCFPQVIQTSCEWNGLRRVSSLSKAGSVWVRKSQGEGRPASILTRQFYSWRHQHWQVVDRQLLVLVSVLLLHLRIFV